MSASPSTCLRNKKHVGDVRQCRIVTPKNPPPLGVGSLQRVDFLISITCAETLWGKRNEKIGRDIRLGGGTSFVGNRECGAGAQSASLAGRTLQSGHPARGCTSR